VYKCLKGGSKEGGARLFSVVFIDQTNGSGHELKHGHFCVKLNVGKHFLL